MPTVPLDRPSLLAAIGAGRSFAYVPFYGHASVEGRVTDAIYSQFYSADFTIDGQTYRWAEQWMMASKARLFGDDAALAAVLVAETPRACKELGRGVRNYDDARWAAFRFDIVTRGNVAKFSQNKAMRDHLLASGDAVLVEAAPRDTIWGVGLGRSDARIADPAAWCGHNLLGFALMRTRAILRGDLPAP